MVLVMRGNEVVIKERRFAPSALRNLVVFSILMMIVPITTYFAARNFYIVHFDGGKTDDGWSPEHIGAGAAVVAIHVLLVWFVYIAFTEDVSDEAEGDDAIINLKNRIKQMEQAVADAEAEKKAQETESPGAADASTERGEQQTEGTASSDPVIEDVQSTAPEISLEQKKDQ